MLIALAFAHFSSELLLKEQMIIPVKKTLNNAGHIDAKLIDFSEICQKNPAKSAVFYWLFLGEVSPRNFLWNRPIFPQICPWKSREILLFFPWNIRSPVCGKIHLRVHGVGGDFVKGWYEKFIFTSAMELGTNHPGLSQPCLSWYTHPLSKRTWKNKYRVLKAHVHPSSFAHLVLRKNDLV